MTARMQGIIYQIRNCLNGKRYIGSTARWEGRKKRHLHELRKGTHHSCIIQAAYKKYGEQSFVFEVIEIVDDVSRLLIREQHYLDTCKPEYNVSLLAGEKTRLGMKSSPEHCAHMSAALKGRASPMKGKRFSAEHRRKIAVANTGNHHVGWHHSPEAIAKMTEKRHANLSRPPHSAARKAKTSAASKRWHASMSVAEKQAWVEKIKRSKNRSISVES